MSLKRLGLLALAASLVLGVPAPTGVPLPDDASNDIASSFLLDLIANVTQTEESSHANAKRFLSCTQDSLVVNLGYARYRGYHNSSTGLNYWKGSVRPVPLLPPHLFVVACILSTRLCWFETDADARRLCSIRYAAPPTGNLRWQPPQVLPPKLNLPIENAYDFGPICPQAMPSLPSAPYIPGDEDRLFLNVYAPAGASNLPVLVYIHEGGYGFGDGRHNMTDIINANDKGFVAVTIQYRVCPLQPLAQSVTD